MTTSSRRATLQAFLAEAPNDPENHYALAMDHASAGDDHGAVERFRAMMRDFPDYVPAYQQAAMALLRLRQPAEARDVLQAGIGRARQTRNQHAAEEMQGLLDTLE